MGTSLRKICLVAIGLGWAGIAFAAMDEGFSGQNEPAGRTFAAPAPAEPDDDSTLATLTEWARDYEMQISGHVMYYDYRETVPSPLKSTETGAMAGLTLGLTHKVHDSDQRFHIEGSFTSGTTTYDGTTQTGTPVVDSTNDSFWDFRFQYAFPLWTIDECNHLRLLTGLNYRYWRRFGQYREDYSWWEIPFGLSYETNFNENFSMEIEHVLNWQHGGRIKVFFSGYDPNLQDAEGIVEDSLGMRVDVRLNFFKQAFIPLVVTPWIEYIHFDQGPEFPIKTVGNTTQGTAYEPASRAWRIGISLGTAFNF